MRRKSYAIRISFICFIVFAVAFSAANAEDWTTYRCDNARSGVTTEQLPSPLSLNWTFEPAHAPRSAWMKPAEELQRMHFDSAYHVSVSGGTVYFGSSVDNKVYAVEAGTGKIRWTFFTEGPVRFAPAIWRDRVYVGSDDGYVYCLRAKDGKPIWKYKAGPSDEKIIGNGRMISLFPVRTSVLVDDGVVYFGAGVFPYEGIYICALKADDGAIIWKNDTMGDRAHELSYGGISPQSYLVASENTLYVPSGRAMPAAFDRESGEFLYYCSTAGKSGGSWALVSEGELIAGVDATGSPAKMVFDEKTGKRKGGAYAWFPGLDMVITPNVAYTLSKEGIHAIDRTAYPEANAKLSALRKTRDELGAMLSDLKGKLSEAADEAQAEEAKTEIGLDSAVDTITERINKITAEEERMLKTLACIWQFPKKDLYNLILAGDMVFAGGKETVIAVDAKTGEEVWSFAVDGIPLGLAAADGKLFVSTDKGPIYCFGGEESQKTGEPESQKAYRKNKLTSTYEAAAEAIVKETGIKKGYCLVLDCGDGRLAYELAKRTELNVIGLESNPKRVQKTRDALDAVGMYGSRVIVEQWNISSLPDYFANLIISDASVVPRKARGWSAEMLRVLKPCGGVAYIPHTSSWMPTPDDGCQTQKSSIENVTMAVRGNLKGAGSWRQLYANPQNTACCDDELVKAPLGLLWFGEPGPLNMVERHGRAEAPVSVNGRLFVQGAEIIMAYDAYNGTLLWEREIPGAVRVRVDVDGGNLAVTENGFYVAAHDKCYRLDPATGETVRTYELPASPDDSPRRWGYISCVDNVLFGSTATPLRREYASVWKDFVKDGAWIGTDEIPSEYVAEYERYKERYPVPDESAWLALQRVGGFWGLMARFPSWSSQSRPKGALTDRIMGGDAVFAVDTETGESLWTHRGSNIANISIAIADGKLFLTEAAVTDEQKAEALKTRQELINSGIYWEGSEAELTPEDADVRLVVALDAVTGEKLWEKPIDLTGCGGDKIGAAYHDGLLLFFGCFSNHDVSLFRNGALRWRRITTLLAKTGEVKWSRPLNYLRRPLIVGDKIIIEPRSCDVRTGEILTRSHPITGKQTPWEFLRPGHSCSVTSATPNAMFYRSYCHAIYDLAEDRGLALFGGIRPGCWVGPIAANGLLMSPEASSGCTCSFPLRSTFVMTHKKRERPREWTVFITHGAATPVEQLNVNFGAPGDMKDDEGALWFCYPRSRPRYGVKFKLGEKIIEGMGKFCYDFRDMSVSGSDKPWLFTSGYLGLLECKVPLIDSKWGEKPGVYTVRLGFMALPGDRVGERVFNVKLQGNMVLRNFDVRRAAGAPNKAVIREFNAVEVTDDLTVEIIPRTLDPTISQAPMVNFIQIIREDAGEIPSAPEYVKAMKKSEAEFMLKEAKAEKDASKALGMYHIVSDAAPSPEFRLQALTGMESIGSPKSLSRIARYCRDTNPILWNYYQPDAAVRDEAIKVYIAIAAKMDEEKAVGMMKHALTMVSDLSLRDQIVTDLENLGVAVDADAAAEGFITRWHIIGSFPRPIDADWRGTLEQRCVNEPDVDVTGLYTVGEKVVKWARYVSAQGMVNLEKLFAPRTNVSAYAYAEFTLAEEQDLLLKIGSDDAFRCWFNGETVGAYADSRIWVVDEDVIKIRGRKGVNAVLLKISQDTNRWSFSARLTNLNNSPVGSF